MALKDVKDVRMQLVQTSVYSLMTGLGIDAISMVDSYFSPLAVLMKCVGICGIAYYAVTWSKFDRVFKCLDLGVGAAYPIQKSKHKTDYSTIYKFTLPAGLCLKDFDDKKDAIEAYLGKSTDIKYTYKEIYIEVYNETKRKFFDYDENIKVNGSVAFPLGYTKHGELVTCNLSKGDDNTHMLIGSTTGGGKSILLKIILTYLITKKLVDLYLMDFKGSEFFIFDHCSCIKKICYDPESALTMLQNLSKIMKERYDKFREKGVRDIWDYNNKCMFNKMKHIVVVADEFSELSDYKEATREIERLSQVGRAAGLNLIICTQRPDAKIVNGRIKGCFTVVAGLKTSDDINSRIIMDNNLLSKLKGKGHCMFRYAGEETELQVMYITDEKIRELIKPYEIKDIIRNKSHIMNGDINDIDLLNAFDKL